MDMTNITIGTAAVVVVLGMAVVFFGLILLMWVIQISSKIFQAKQKKAASPAAAEPAASVPADPAPGSAGDLKLYDTDPKDAAMIMAIVADKMGKPLNELRFKSIKEVK